jgi:hypothetical protein
MSNLKHTPGQWRQEKQYIVSKRANPEKEQPICLVMDSSMNLEAEANMSLILAAPSILAALKAAKEWIDRPEMHAALKEAVTKAIDKATT